MRNKKIWREVYEMASEYDYPEEMETIEHEDDIDEGEYA